MSDSYSSDSYHDSYNICDVSEVESDTMSDCYIEDSSEEEENDVSFEEEKKKMNVIEIDGHVWACDEYGNPVKRLRRKIDPKQTIASDDRSSKLRPADDVESDTLSDCYVEDSYGEEENDVSFEEEKKKMNVIEIDGHVWALDEHGNPVKKLRRKGDPKPTTASDDSSSKVGPADDVESDTMSDCYVEELGPDDDLEIEDSYAEEEKDVFDPSWGSCCEEENDIPFGELWGSGDKEKNDDKDACKRGDTAEETKANEELGPADDLEIEDSYAEEEKDIFDPSWGSCGEEDKEENDDKDACKRGDAAEETKANKVILELQKSKQEMHRLQRLLLLQEEASSETMKDMMQLKADYTQASSEFSSELEKMKWRVCVLTHEIVEQKSMMDAIIGGDRRKFEEMLEKDVGAKVHPVILELQEAKKELRRLKEAQKEELQRLQEEARKEKAKSTKAISDMMQLRADYKEANLDVVELDHYFSADDFKKKELLPKVIHAMVRSPAYVDTFRQIFLQNPKIVDWKDAENRTVLQMACAECRNVTLFMGRYQLDETAMYESPTCKVFFAVDWWKDGKLVAIKFIIDKANFDREIRARRHGDGKGRFSNDYVTGDLGHYNAEKDKAYSQACKDWSELGKYEFPDYCIVLDRGNRSLHEVMATENLADKPLEARTVSKKLCDALVYLHQQRYVHGDVKPRNFLRHSGSGYDWKMIDFDACVRIGEMIGQKLSTGYVPPELVRVVEIVNEQDDSMQSTQIIKPTDDDAVSATESFDVWSFGITLYHMLTGQSFFHCDDRDNLINLSDLSDLTDSTIQRRLEVVEDVNARVLLSSILKVDPKARPTMKQIQLDIYFNPFDIPQGRRAPTLGKRSKEPTIAPASVASRPSEQAGANDEDFETFVSKIGSDTSFFYLKDLDKDWNDKLLYSEVQALNFESLKAIGSMPRLIDGDAIFQHQVLRDNLCEKGPDKFMGSLVKFFELYKIMDEAEHICEKIKANLVRDVKGLKGIFVKLFVRGKGLNDIVRGTLFCDSINQFEYVAEQLQAKFNVYIKPPKNEQGGWPVPKMLVWSKTRTIDGKCMTVELQFSTVYLHLAKHVSSNHLVYEIMRVSTPYLAERKKDVNFQKFLDCLNQDYFDTQGFVKEEEEQVQLGSFEILLTQPATEESVSESKVLSTGLVLSGLVRCHGRKFAFRAPEGYMKQFSPSSFMVNNCLTLLSEHSYWSEESYELEEKVVEFVVSFNDRGTIFAGIGTKPCLYGTLEEEDSGNRCSVILNRSSFVVRRNGVVVETKKKRLGIQQQGILRFEIDNGKVSVSYTSAGNNGGIGLAEDERSEIEMPTNHKFHLYMRGPPGVHDMKYHSVEILETNVAGAMTADLS